MVPRSSVVEGEHAYKHTYTHKHTLFHFSNRWNLEGPSVGGSHEAYFINQAQCFSPLLLGEEMITGVNT